MKFRVLLTLTAFAAFCVSLGALENPIILPTDDPDAPESHRVIWPTEPGVRYELQESTGLQSWTVVEGFPWEATASIMEYSFPIESGDRRFFRVLQLVDFVPEGFTVIEGGTLSMSMGTRTVKTFQIARYEVTWGEWQEVRAYAEANGYDIGSRGAGCTAGDPVHSVNWFDALKWCNARSQKEGLTPVYMFDGAVFKTGEPDHATVSQDLSANGYRLPLEAEWEFAARGGNHTNGYTYAGSNDLNAVGWHWNNAGGAACGLSHGRGTWPVGRKTPNELGIYDMSGNVGEWCWDQQGSDRPVRGGTWASGVDGCAVSLQVNGPPDFRSLTTGFRLARTASP